MFVEFSTDKMFYIVISKKHFQVEWCWGHLRSGICKLIGIQCNDSGIYGRGYWYATNMYNILLILRVSLIIIQTCISIIIHIFLMCKHCHVKLLALIFVLRITKMTSPCACTGCWLVPISYGVPREIHPPQARRRFAAEAAAAITLAAKRLVAVHEKHKAGETSHA